jgi:thiamine-monophosphate kinase
MALSEFQLIQRYFSKLTQTRDDVVLGIGDDCALLDPPVGKQLAVTMDTLVAGRHFVPDVDPESLGHKALAVNLSDLAAMGAEPAWATLALSLPDVDEQWLASFARGFSHLAAEYAVQLVGGDTTSGPLSISIQVLGFVDPDMALRRDGAHPGDSIYVTGELGLAALELCLLQQDLLDWCADALDKPWPRVKEGMALAGIASAAIDISDGLLADLGHICQASGTGARIQCAMLPLDQRVKQHIQSTGDWSLPLSGGDDYQLCFTVAPHRQQQLEQLMQEQGFCFSLIGQIEPGQDVQVIMPDGRRIKPAVSGFDHFK